MIDIDRDTAHIPVDSFEYLLSQMEQFFENSAATDIRFCKARIAFRTLCDWSPRRIEKTLNDIHKIGEI